MDENGLPITGAGVNYAAVEAINQRELITYMNLFLIRTCTFLNNFSTKCESKLASLHTRLESIDTSITLLETKLNSVEELKNMKPDETNNAPAANTATTEPQTQTATVGAPIPPPPPPMNSSQQATTVPVVAPPPPPPPTPPPPSNPISQDPRYSKYFKMVKMGVAEEAGKVY